jgi:peptidylprolyl isomerase/peptidyl-prolyl cis-trans isomerase B (cyclophilin B)
MKKSISLTLLLLLSTLFSMEFNKPVLPKEDYVVTISTKFGKMILLLNEQTPKHKANFIKLASSNFYDSTTFHRVIKDFMIQGGDPNSKNQDPNDDGMGDPGYTIPAEILPFLNHDKGALSAARKGDDINPEKASSGSQFFIVQNKEGASYLDGNYTVFGHVIEGMHVIDKIAQQPVDDRSRPLSNIEMKVSVQKLKTAAILKQYQCEWFYNSNE